MPPYIPVLDGVPQPVPPAVDRRCDGPRNPLVGDDGAALPVAGGGGEGAEALRLPGAVLLGGPSAGGAVHHVVLVRVEEPLAEGVARYEVDGAGAPRAGAGPHLVGQLEGLVGGGYPPRRRWPRRNRPRRHE